MASPLLLPPSHHSSSPPSLLYSKLSLPQDPQGSSAGSWSTLALRDRLSKLCREGRLEAARQLFDSLPRPAPALLWNALLIGYVCNAMPRDALALFALMNSSSSSHGTPRPDHYSYSSVLKACADARQLRLGKSVHAHIIRRAPTPPRNRVLNNSLLNMYASSLEPPCVDVVRKLFDRIPKRNAVAWNIMISWYVRSLRPVNALEQFRLMMEIGIRPTMVSFINVFPAVMGAGLKRCADALYGLLIKFGSEYVNDVRVVSSAMFMYSELSDVESARRIFDSATEKNIEVWNTMIGGYVENKRFEEAIALFVQILELGVFAADTVTFLSSLMAVSQLQDLRLGQQIHAYLIKEKNSEELPVILCNALVVVYSRCGCAQLAFELFHQMQQRDIVSWNTMISALVQNGLDFEGLMLVYEMQKEGFMVDSVTVVALLSAASNLGSLRIGKDTHGYLIRHGIQCEGLESYLIDVYSKSGSVEIARRIFDCDLSDERDQVTWNAMIAGYMQNQQNEEAMSVFREMLEDKKMPNSVTLSSVLPACNPVGGIKAGKEVHGFAIRQCLDSNIFVGTALVGMYSKCGAIIIAERVFTQMAEKNNVTYTMMLSGLGQHGLGERALSLFQAMIKSGIKPDALTFVAVISACSYSGLVDEGLAVFKTMEEFGIVATPEHYCCIVDLLGRAGRVEEAYEFVQGLGDRGNSVGIWGSLLAACNVHGKYEMGKFVSDRLFEIEEAERAAGYRVLLSNVYAAEGKWGNVDRVRKAMREKGLRKEPGSSWIDFGDSSHRFMSKDQSHPENEQIYAMLEELASEMKLSSCEPADPCLEDGAFELN